ncbi:hypothetical protein CIHG_09231 [Coccidioides immitis H538.4]|uniref:Uncharacterized protein n=2 Tax=Coccidioides immitis TaxID=5501 RepID=A0A0J8UUJ6_COCIT|nr:hypothetical protein CIRG_07766 [Coccidioides immitis RMSCC 2394]KMU91478.1 hypothetical protein CIHG_09231 [Coccidioides immitis H538.4]
MCYLRTAGKHPSPTGSRWGLVFRRKFWIKFSNPALPRTHWHCHKLLLFFKNGITHQFHRFNISYCEVLSTPCPAVGRRTDFKEVSKYLSCYIQAIADTVVTADGSLNLEILGFWAVLDARTQGIQVDDGASWLLGNGFPLPIESGLLMRKKHRKHGSKRLATAAKRKISLAYGPRSFQRLPRCYSDGILAGLGPFPSNPQLTARWKAATLEANPDPTKASLTTHSHLIVRQRFMRNRMSGGSWHSPAVQIPEHSHLQLEFFAKCAQLQLARSESLSAQRHSNDLTISALWSLESK